MKMTRLTEKKIDELLTKHKPIFVKGDEDKYTLVNSTEIFDFVIYYSAEEQEIVFTQKNMVKTYCLNNRIDNLHTNYYLGEDVVKEIVGLWDGRDWSYG